MRFWTTAIEVALFAGTVHLAQPLSTKASVWLYLCVLGVAVVNFVQGLSK
jgi:hypothetical protein